MLPVVLGTRLLFLGLTLLIPAWRAFFGVAPLMLRSDTGTVLDQWNRSDVQWYMDIARLGYNLRGPAGFKNVAFFPLFPLLTRTLHDALALVARDVLALPLASPFDPPYLVPGMIVANVCAVAALAYFYGMVRLDYGRAAARRAVTLLSLSPMAFFLAAAYSEGTFLLCVLAFFYALRLERWWQAGLWGLLAAATRPPGAVLLVPFLLAWAQAHPVVGRAVQARLRLAGRAVEARLRAQRASLGARGAAAARPMATAIPLDFTEASAHLSLPAQDRTPRRRAAELGGTSAARAPRRPRDWPEELRRALRNGLPAVAIPLGLLLFMAFLYNVFGDPLWFSRAQQAWWRTFAPPWETLYISVTWPLGDLLRHGLLAVDASAAQDLCYEVAGLALTWLAWRRLPRAQGIYMWLLWVILLSSPAMLTDRRTGEVHRDVLMSLPRMLLMMFPLFTYLGLQRRLYPWLVALFTAALAVYTGMFLTGGWVS